MIEALRKRLIRLLGGSTVHNKEAFLRAAQEVAHELFEEERAMVQVEERVAEYNRGYLRALEDCFHAEFPNLEKGSGFTSYRIAGHAPVPGDDGRLTMEEL